MGEHNELKNRYMVVNPPDGLTASDEVEVLPPPLADGYDIEADTEQAPNKLPTYTEQVRRLVCALAQQSLSLKELMSAVGLKHRPTFLENYLNPALHQGFISLLYPESPRHPRQKYLLTAQGTSLFNAVATYKG